MVYNEPKLFYEDGSEVNGVVTNYKPPLPSFNTIKNKPLKGNTRFQTINGKNDTKIRFTLAFNIIDCGKDSYKKFLIHYGDLFKFKDEWGYTYTGRLEPSMDIDMPIEADIYYIAVEMLCNCEVSGI
ncbi:MULTISPECIES: hypothetical protein [unclassified Clostridium]|uniref:hypothetical protein n=1 Tax=unclassified Clostridium TaxID=2614128 RepID=UPI0002973095|nr:MULTISPECIES: hypothetical protein [unclassified Clostridium]EKQ52750.1 MAG: hypothetical protein A370_04055 [Clostridium sp. Maddingley MBC34-26]